ncbi:MULTISPECIES: ATP-dependent RNA helicase HrpA [unclassified Rhodanobacter]|uniref:ATP-dependent RNA helicase HrpA n=1 Tax=unclassified Rhodanobacter TaxID=2621553 RepID=UPI001BE0BB2F|nr:MULTISPECIES: ATP-dependent RNA helicase HrpA [unclassified Rhodanobacter]MBT2145401.1 ATP-dependent RNA helicase HrpA [Rhodanobacter sp. LX-99]MBT2149446.1 ATP-dependent RNA helicase HrpA [Rhodanobacter sp. LX-100]
MNDAQPPATDPTADPGLRRLRRKLDAVCSRDFGRLLGRWRALSRRPDEKKLGALVADIERSAAKRRARVAAKPPIRLDESLPISARGEDIVKLIREHQVVVIAGETGSGKTTQLPKLCLAAGRGEAGMIGCTQPRRLAARSVARRVAEELGTPLGEVVGFQVRFNDQVSERSLIKFMTDGILLAETQGDPWLSAYDTIIIDEAHERSLNIDFLLGYLKRLALKRPELKIIVTSATIDTARFAEHFDGAPVVEVEGRAYPVELRWRSLDEIAARQGRGKDMQQGSAEHIAAVLDEITHDDPRGDVLVFLPGEREIRDAHQLLSRRQYRETEIMPLYARLSAGDQDRVFKPGVKRRVVLATNVAETSLTVPRIRYVIDTGTARVKRYSQRSQLERLHVEPVSQAAADQRKGRCGRVGPGICYRLYDEADFAGRAAFTDPELLRSSLANVILRMLALQLGEVDEFPFLEAPDPRVVADGFRRLTEISAIDDARRLTPIGRTLARLPIDVQLARMLVEGGKLHALRELLTIVSFLSIQDPRERPGDARQQADAAHAAFADPKSDFVGVLNLWRAYHDAHEELTQSKLRDWCSRHFLSFMRMREWRELHRQLLLVVQELGWKLDVSPSAQGEARSAPPPARRGRLGGGEALKVKGTLPQPSPASRGGSESDAERLYESVHRALLAGLPTQVGRKDEKGVYQSTRERKFQVFPGSALAKAPPNWIFSAQILDVGGRVWGMANARVEPLWIEQQAAHLLRMSCRDAHWSKKRGCVVAYEQVSLFGLVLVEKRPVTFQQRDPALAHAIFLREALVRGDIDSADHGRSSAAGAGRAGAAVDFVRANQRVLEEALGIEAKQRREGLIRHEDDLVAFFEGKLPEDVASSRALDAWYRKARPAEQAALRWSLDDVLVGGAGLDAKAFPAALEIPPLAMDGRVPRAQDAQERPQRYKLEYRFVPGDEADGVTLHLPLAMLNALPPDRCEWLVPGLLADKVAELIRGLPKALRRNFVPAPDFARAFAEAESPRDESLAKALATFLKRTTGVDIAAGDFAAVELPPHFLMRYRLHDERGKTLAGSRDLAALRGQWEGQAREAFSRKTDIELTREDVSSWDFEEIPAQVRSDGGLAAFPALVDLGETVALRVFERGDEARAAHRQGVVRLLRNALASEAKQARRRLPIGNALALQYAPLGGVDGLRQDLLEGGFADLLEQHELDVRTAAAFEKLRAQFSRELFGAGVERLKLAEPVIEAQAELKPWLQPPLLGFARASYDDLREQFDALLPPGFLRDLPPARLAHYPRYLRAMRLRAERLRLDPAKDQQRMLQVLPYWRAYLQHRAAGADAAELAELRWLIEEWRVSLFAQELKTAEPVSAKRLAKALAALG